MSLKKNFSCVKDKSTVLVTGASRGIGYAIAQKLHRENFQVVGVARNFPHSYPFAHYPIDLSNLETLPAALKSLSREFPEIRYLICNAGRGHFGSLEEFSYAQIRSLTELNFLSHVYLVKAFLPKMKQANHGHIVFIGSEAALSGKRKGSVYCATKFALRGFSQALREECAPYHIRTTLINPGVVNTPFFQDLTFEPGPQPHEHLIAEDIAEAVALALNARAGAVYDEINLSPQTKRILKKAPNINPKN